MWIIGEISGNLWSEGLRVADDAFSMGARGSCEKFRIWIEADLASDAAE